eukprot:Tbor_TRINITY_DN4863_c0_g1::TRINITY_DN4863_c0_g1_i11::g.1483::m.1483
MDHSTTDLSDHEKLQFSRPISPNSNQQVSSPPRPVCVNPTMSTNGINTGLANSGTYSTQNTNQVNPDNHLVFSLNCNVQASPNSTLRSQRGTNSNENTMRRSHSVDNVNSRRFQPSPSTGVEIRMSSPSPYGNSQHRLPSVSNPQNQASHNVDSQHRHSSVNSVNNPQYTSSHSFSIINRVTSFNGINQLHQAYPNDNTHSQHRTHSANNLYSRQFQASPNTRVGKRIFSPSYSQHCPPSDNNPQYTASHNDSIVNHMSSFNGNSQLQQANPNDDSQHRPPSVNSVNNPQNQASPHDSIGNRVNSFNGNSQLLQASPNGNSQLQQANPNVDNQHRPPSVNSVNSRRDQATPNGSIGNRVTTPNGNSQLLQASTNEGGQRRTHSVNSRRNQPSQNSSVSNHVTSLNEGRQRRPHSVNSRRYQTSQNTSLNSSTRIPVPSPNGNGQLQQANPNENNQHRPPSVNSVNSRRDQATPNGSIGNRVNSINGNGQLLQVYPNVDSQHRPPSVNSVNNPLGQGNFNEGQLGANGSGKSDDITGINSDREPSCMTSSSNSEVVWDRTQKPFMPMVTTMKVREVTSRNKDNINSIEIRLKQDERHRSDSKKTNKSSHVSNKSLPYKPGVSRSISAIHTMPDSYRKIYNPRQVNRSISPVKTEEWKQSPQRIRHRETSTLSISSRACSKYDNEERVREERYQTPAINNKQVAITKDKSMSPLLNLYPPKYNTKKFKIVSYLRDLLLPLFKRGQITRKDTVVACSAVVLEFMREMNLHTADMLISSPDSAPSAEEKKLLFNLLLSAVCDLEQFKVNRVNYETEKYPNDALSLAMKNIREKDKAEEEQRTNKTLQKEEQIKTLRHKLMELAACRTLRPEQLVEMEQRLLKGDEEVIDFLINTRITNVGSGLQNPDDSPPFKLRDNIIITNPPDVMSVLSGKPLLVRNNEGLVADIEAERLRAAVTNPTAEGEVSIFNSVSYVIGGTFPEIVTNSSPRRLDNNRYPVNVVLNCPLYHDPECDVVVIGSVTMNPPITAVDMSWLIAYGPDRTVMNLDKMFENKLVTTYQIGNSSFILAFKAGSLLPGWDYFVYLGVVPANTSQGDQTSYDGQDQLVSAQAEFTIISDDMVLPGEETYNDIDNNNDTNGQFQLENPNNEGDIQQQTYDDPNIYNNNRMLCYDNQQMPPQADMQNTPSDPSYQGPYDNQQYNIENQIEGVYEYYDSPDAKGKTASGFLALPNDKQASISNYFQPFQEQLKLFIKDHIEPLYTICDTPVITEEEFKVLLHNTCMEYAMKYQPSQVLTTDITRDIILSVKEGLTSILPQQ